MANNNQLEKYRGLSGTIRKMSGEIQSALPDFMRANADRWTRIALTALHDGRLLACTENSILAALMESAQLGLECDGVLGQGYLIPYGHKCSFQLGYRGIVQLVRRSGDIRRIKAVCVYEGDEFAWDEGEDRIVHRPSLDQKRFQQPITHCYAKALLSTGDLEFCVWSREQIDDHKKRYSKAWNKSDSPWKTAWPAMAQKTMLIQLCKSLPVSVETQRVVLEDDLRASKPAEPAPSTSIVDDVTKRIEDKEALAALESRFSGETSPENGSETPNAAEADANTPQENGAQGAVFELPEDHQKEAVAAYADQASITHCRELFKLRVNTLAETIGTDFLQHYIDFEERARDARMAAIREQRGAKSNV